MNGIMRAVSISVIWRCSRLFLGCISSRLASLWGSTCYDRESQRVRDCWLHSSHLVACRDATARAIASTRATPPIVGVTMNRWSSPVSRRVSWRSISATCSIAPTFWKRSSLTSRRKVRPTQDGSDVQAVNWLPGGADELGAGSPQHMHDMKHRWGDGLQCLASSRAAAGEGHDQCVVPQSRYPP